MSCRGLLVAGGVCLAAFTAQAQQAAPPPACDSAAYHQFDFWLGEWQVSDGDGTLQGTNSITSEEGGCVLVERWASVRGNTGQSYNFYSPASDEWRQVWVSAGSIIDYTGGLTETGSMKLTGTITYHRSGQSAPFTGEWTPNDDGSVTQHFEQYSADKDEWVTWFTGIYRRAASETPETPDAG